MVLAIACILREQGPYLHLNTKVYHNLKINTQEVLPDLILVVHIYLRMLNLRMNYNCMLFALSLSTFFCIYIKKKFLMSKQSLDYKICSQKLSMLWFSKNAIFCQYGALWSSDLHVIVFIEAFGSQLCCRPNSEINPILKSFFLNRDNNIHFSFF